MDIYKSNSIFDQLDLSLLRHFYAIASHGGFSKASRATKVSQPALSLGLQRLEKSLGVSLVEREGGKFSLTVPGRTLFSFCQKLEGNLESVIGSIGGETVAARKRLRIGTALSIGFSPLTETCVGNNARSEPYELELVAQNTYQLIEQVVSGSLDAALVPDDVYDARLETQKLLVDQITLVADRGCSKIFEKKEWKDALTESTLITYPRETPMRALVDKICLHQELKFKTVVTTNSVEGLKLLARRGVGVAFALRSLVKPDLEEGALRELATPFQRPKTGIVVATRAGDEAAHIRQVVTRLIQRPEYQS